VDGPKKRFYYLLHTLVEEMDAITNWQDGNPFKRGVASCRPIVTAISITYIINFLLRNVEC